MLKKIFIICLFLFTSIQYVNATKYYISPSGGDLNKGSAASPWKTLSHATSQVNNQGDIIFVTQGTYYENQQSFLKPGVSIEGNGLTSHIISQLVLPLIVLESFEGTLGNQHISGIQIDGNGLVGNTAILINGRSIVNIHDCSFVNFKSGASYFDADGYEYVIEIRNSYGGIEINNNIIEGGIRGLFVKKSGSSNCLDIHHNKIGKNTMSAISEAGIYVCDVEDLYIRNNSFKNLMAQIVITSYSNTLMRNVFIYNNIMTDIGVASEENYGSGIMLVGLTSEPARNINIINNTIVANPGSRPTMIGIWLPTIGNAKYVVVRNNIIMGFKYASMFAAGPEPTMDSVYVENNILYENAIEGVKVDSATNLPYFTNVPLPLHYVEQDNIEENPYFMSSTDFHLQSTSPGIKSGIYTSWITEDYAGGSMDNPPNIGAYGNNLPTVIVDPLKYKLLVYPVPAIDYVNIVVEDPNFSPKILKVFNFIGQQVINEYVSDNNIFLPLNLPSGTYIIVVLNSRSQMMVAKIIIY